MSKLFALLNVFEIFQVPYPIIIPIKKPQYHHSHHHDLHTHHHPGHDSHQHQHLSTYDHHTDYTNNKYQQINAQRPHSSEQSSSASSSASGEHQDFAPRPEHLRETQSNAQPQEYTKLFSPSQQPEQPYNQQHQLHHQQQYAQLRRDLLTRERMRSSSEESEDDSTEFRPMISQSSEYMSPSNNVETVVPPPPNQQTRSTFHINVPEESEPEKETTATSGPVNNQYTHNIEIPVHFYRLQPMANGEGFEITS